jgi:hypothetical protein
VYAGRLNATSVMESIGANFVLTSTVSLHTIPYTDGWEYRVTYFNIHVLPEAPRGLGY